MSVVLSLQKGPITTSLPLAAILPNSVASTAKHNPMSPDPYIGCVTTLNGDPRPVHFTIGVIHAVLNGDPRPVHFTIDDGYCPDKGLGINMNST